MEDIWVCWMEFLLQTKTIFAPKQDYVEEKRVWCKYIFVESAV